MIQYKGDVLSRLKDAGYSQYVIRRDRVMGQRDLQRIRDGIPTRATVNRLCSLLDCQPGDILEYIPDPPDPSKE